MKLYFELLKMPVFTVEDVNRHYNNVESARSAIKRLMNEGMIVRIRNNMYTCISGETMAPIANRFQIASKITPTSYVSHHTAMEYYGITDQVYYDVYVASETSFREFEFDGYTYRYVMSNSLEGVELKEFSGGIRITNPERTLVDSVKDMDKIAGMEEVIQDITSMRRVKEDKIIQYLSASSNQFLYQKMGYLLSHYENQLGLSDYFFELCKSKIGKSKRYLTKDTTNGHYIDEWKLVIPDSNHNTKNGAIDNAIL